MKRSDEKLVSRGIDREVDAEERKRLDVILSTDPDAVATDSEWRRIGDTLRHAPVRSAVPDVAVAWRDIQRAIREQGQGVEGERRIEFPSGWRMPWAAAAAALLVVGLLGWSSWRLLRPSTAPVPIATATADRVEWVVAEIPGATTMIYSDAEDDLTVIWMDVAQDRDPRDT